MVIDDKHQIITIGDSLTAGWQMTYGEYAPFSDATFCLKLATTYPYMLGQMVSPRWGGDFIKNLGRSGSTSQDWLRGSSWQKRDCKDFPLNGKPLDELIESKELPKICLMMLGTNDVNFSIPPDWISRAMGGLVGYEDQDFLMTRENLISVLIELKHKGISTYLAKIPPNRLRGGIRTLGIDKLIFNNPGAQIKLDSYTRRVNEHIEDIWHSYPELASPGPDFYELLQDTENIWCDDRLHLNTQGYRLVAEAWADLLISDGVVIQDRG